MKDVLEYTGLLVEGLFHEERVVGNAKTGLGRGRLSAGRACQTDQ
jgi:hypothetical protein